MLKAADLFDLNTTAHAALFDGTAYAWDALNHIEDYIRARLAADMPANSHTFDLHPTVVIEGEVYIGEGTTIAPGVYIQGPTVIGRRCEIRHGAFVRAGTLLADGAIVGHATETKNSVLLEDAHAPHFSYVGDSILGQRVNLGAGTKLSNFPMNADIDPQTGKRPSLQFPFNGQRLDTGVVKFGAIMGDDVQTGCNAVTNPGTVIGPRTMVYTLAMLKKGYYPADSIIKLRQTHEIAARE